VASFWLVSSAFGQADSRFLFAKVEMGLALNLDADHQALGPDAPESALPPRQQLLL
jgi:hypothetical protein